MEKEIYDSRFTMFDLISHSQIINCNLQIPFSLYSHCVFVVYYFPLMKTGSSSELIVQAI